MTVTWWRAARARVRATEIATDRATTLGDASHEAIKQPWMHFQQGQRDRELGMVALLGHRQVPQARAARTVASTERVAASLGTSRAIWNAICRYAYTYLSRKNSRV
ncbi:unnamed protein product (plasmid) [Mycetohabitans rhizoxinica HKI 454]|uniref:Uncharacterized protein n=1 Tax=Mycetohabitans rhizoxinica (strain DSM 19002 / CIP 109453 / HKI 454) TaxID=882378 RepID=E5ATQ4_MYCRK|nr:MULTISPECIES: hypothetical protein [Mycetohabitans]MCG1048649.1 hypothetical protein [Mycetohabitans sp. B6]CBW76478.1 unnamed protein product [Mycetohabitans rhizoxinica HKI 454]